MPTLGAVQQTALKPNASIDLGHSPIFFWHGYCMKVKPSAKCHPYTHMYVQVCMYMHIGTCHAMSCIMHHGADSMTLPAPLALCKLLQCNNQIGDSKALGLGNRGHA